MPQAPPTPRLPKETEELFARLERRWRFDDWFNGVFLIAIFLLLIVGSVLFLLK